MKFMVKKLQWDSEFFNLNIGEIQYNDNYDEKDSSNYDLIYIYSNEDVDLKIPNFEKTFSEIKVTFFKKIEVNNYVSENIFQLDEVDVNKEKLYSLAYESGKNSRFLLDKKFNEVFFKKLYKAWIDNSINKKFADDILVYFEENQLKGFVTYKINNNDASVGLIAVDTTYQAKGIGTKLLKYLENILVEKKVEIIMIPTQMSNIQACNFYHKQGYSIKSKKHIKHYWKI